MKRKFKRNLVVEAISVLFIVFILSFAAISVFRSKINSSLMPVAADLVKIVIDAGHGGEDPGCIYGDIKESDINYRIVKKLEQLLTDKGFMIILTRDSYDGLYYMASTVWDKDEDMLERKNIINNCGASLFISIHQNSFSNSGVKGAQMFFNDKHEDNEALANNLQVAFAGISPYTNNRQPLMNNDYFLLRNSPCPAVLIECGFLSNETDRELLTNDAYLDDIAYAIYKTVCLYFGVEY